MTALERSPLNRGLSPRCCAEGSSTCSCSCQQRAVVLGRAQGKVAPCSANGTCIVHASPASGEDVAWSEAAPGDARSQKPWGRLLHRVPWGRRAELPRGSQLPVASTSWEGSQNRAQLRWRLPRAEYLLSHTIPARLGIYIAVPLPFLLACPGIPFPGCRRQLFGK